MEKMLSVEIWGVYSFQIWITLFQRDNQPEKPGIEAA